MGQEFGRKSSVRLPLAGSLLRDDTGPVGCDAASSSQTKGARVSISSALSDVCETRQSPDNAIQSHKSKVGSFVIK